MRAPARFLVRLAQREQRKSKVFIMTEREKNLIKIAKLDAQLHSVLQGSETVASEVIFSRG